MIYISKSSRKNHLFNDLQQRDTSKYYEEQRLLKMQFVVISYLTKNQSFIIHMSTSVASERVNLDDYVGIFLQDSSKRMLRLASRRRLKNNAQKRNVKMCQHAKASSFSVTQQKVEPQGCFHCCSFRIKNTQYCEHYRSIRLC